MKTKHSFFSRQYVGGLISGVGFGILIANATLATRGHHMVINAFLWFSAVALTLIGPSVGRRQPHQSVKEPIIIRSLDVTMSKPHVQTQRAAFARLFENSLL